MGSALKQKYAPLICTAAFAVMIVVTALIGSIIVLESTYVTLTVDYSSLSTYRAVSKLLSSANVSAFQMFLVFLGGTSIFALPVCMIVAAWRGISLGFTLAVVSQGKLSFSSGGSLSIFGLFEIPSSAVALFMYFLVSAVMLLFMSSAISFSERMRREDVERSALLKRYVLLFFVLSGACSLCDIIKSLLI